MKRYFITPLFALAIASGAFAQAPQAADFNRAVMQAYEEMLRENYKDYEVLFRRANEYYNHGDYLRALEDLDSAVKYCPESDSDLRFSIYALRAECYYELKRYAQALPEATQALNIDPTSTAMLNLRGRIEYDFNQLTEAKADFSKLLRINSRSQEALFGLALVAAKENNVGLAGEYMEKAVALTPSDSNAFIRRAKVKQIMGDYNGAVDDLLLAMATDADTAKALPALVELADTNYPAVASGLSGAIRQAPRQPLYYFLRGSIAASHYHYGAAIADFKYIISENLYNYAGLYCSLAECYYALGDYETALDEVDTALAKYTDEDDPARYFTVRARIQRALKQTDKAMLSINRALDILPDNSDAMVEKALILTDQKKAKDASALLGEVIMAEPYQPMNYLLRAWVMNDFLNQQKAAKGLYTRVCELELDHPEQIGSMLGFAQLFNGQTAKAVEWMEACLKEPDGDGHNHYLGACFYAWAGRKQRALECMEDALKAGYANYYDWTLNSDGRVNVSPIRDDAKFKELLEQYKSIFSK